MRLLSILPVGVFSLINRQDINYFIIEVNTIKHSKATYAITPCIRVVSSQFLDVVSEERLLFQLRIDISTKLFLEERYISLG